MLLRFETLSAFCFADSATSATTIGHKSLQPVQTLETELGKVAETAHIPNLER